MQLVIAEKPSVAGSIAAALGVKEKKDGYIEGGGYLISWCVGHLVELADAAAYGEQYKKWSYESLPILPEEWQYTVSAGKEKQFATLKELMHRSDVSEIVNACDAGREGELIFRFVYHTAGCKKPMRRLWISSMEESAIKAGFADLKDGRDYDALYASALCRAKADWIIGINATRLFSCLYNKTLNVGRVQTPTLKMLTDRDEAISHFKKETYYHVRLDLSIKFDNGASLFIGNHRTPQAKTAKVQNECVNAALVRYNPEIIAATKEAAISALRKREAKDNEIAAQKGLKPYTLLNVEFNDGADEKGGGYTGWYYVTLAVDGKIHAHIETGLNYDILDGKVSENPTRENYFTAGALKETDVDYVFNNVGFSSTTDLYSLPVRDDVLERAEKTLAERNAGQPETKVTYYPINEAAAKRAKEAISYSDYKPGSATAEYRHYVDEAAELAARQKKRVDPSFHAKIDGLLDAYARKLAANMNKGYEITARVPSVLITGGSNFPVRKKEKQNAAADKNMQEFTEIQGLLDKIRSTGMGGISADDPNAVSKLESKLAKLEKAQETMKAVNAYYRKNKTLDGCPHLSAEQTEKLKASMSGSYRANPKPFESYQLSNNNAEIHRLKDRITALTRRKELGYVGWEFDGGRVEANTADNRLQIFFDEKPDIFPRLDLITRRL